MSLTDLISQIASMVALSAQQASIDLSTDLEPLLLETLICLSEKRELLVQRQEGSNTYVCRVESAEKQKA